MNRATALEQRGFSCRVTRTHTKPHLTALAAIAATVWFGYLAGLALNGAFENPRATLFQRFELFWTFLHWLVPACIIGMLEPSQAIRMAALTRLIASAILIAWGYPQFVPVGSLLPDPPIFLLYMAEEAVIGIPCAMLLAWLAAAISNKPKPRAIVLALTILPFAAYLAWTPSPNAPASRVWGDTELIPAMR